MQQLQLEPHPEGGFYRETFRDERAVEGGRSASTAILYLLPAGAKSKLHRLDAAECWHAYLGAPGHQPRRGRPGVFDTLLASWHRAPRLSRPNGLPCACGPCPHPPWIPPQLSPHTHPCRRARHSCAAGRAGPWASAADGGRA